MNATGTMGRTRKGLFTGLNLKINTATVVIIAAVMLLVGLFLGVMLADYLVGYGTIGSFEVIVSDSTNGGVPTSLGTFQAHEVSSWFSLERRNHLRFTVTRMVTQDPLQ